MTNKSTILIESRITDGQYGLSREMMIVDHPVHGRLLLAEEYGGELELRGGGYRWGSAFRLQAGDTFAALDEDWNESTTILEAVHACCDTARPWLDWPPFIVARIAAFATTGVRRVTGARESSRRAFSSFFDATGLDCLTRSTRR